MRMLVLVRFGGHQKECERLLHDSGNEQVAR